MRPPRKSFSTRSIRRSCCITPRPSSPTAANSASVPKSASRRENSTPAARSASSSSPASNIASTARDRHGREHTACSRQGWSRRAEVPRTSPGGRSGPDTGPLRGRIDPAPESGSGLSLNEASAASRHPRHSASHSRHADRPARRLFQSAPSRPPRDQPVRNQATAARSGLVAGEPGKSAQGHHAPARSRGARRSRPQGRR